MGYWLGKPQKSYLFLVARPLRGGGGGLRAWPLRKLLKLIFVFFNQSVDYAPFIRNQLSRNLSVRHTGLPTNKLICREASLLKEIKQKCLYVLRNQIRNQFTRHTDIPTDKVIYGGISFLKKERTLFVCLICN